MALKNYSSTVSASRSISHIEDVLAAHRAPQVLKLYDPDGRVEAIAFVLSIDGVEISFRLPAHIGKCEEVLKGRVRRPRSDTYRLIHQQAERTAWKIVSDWVDAQMAMIDLTQVEIMEVFLPYVYDSARGQTYFEVVKERGYQKVLTGSCETSSRRTVECDVVQR